MSSKKNQIYIWFGENDYDARKSILAWQEKFIEKYSDFNIVRIDLEDASLKKEDLIKDLKNAFFADSLFGSTKLILLKSFLLSDTKKFSPSVKSKLKEIENMVVDLVLRIPEKFYVIFWQKQNIDKRKGLYKKIQSTAIIKEFKIPRGYELNKWLENELKLNNASATQQAIAKLVLLVGNDLWQLGHEIKKLSAYKKDQQIDEQDVDFMVKSKFDDNIFNLMDAISTKNKKTAVKFFYDQLNSGANELYLLAMTIKQFKTLIKVRQFLDHNPGTNSNLIAKEFKLHPFVAQKSFSQCSHFTFAELKNIYKELLQMDVKIKSTNTDLPMLFDMFISKI